MRDARAAVELVLEAIQTMEAFVQGADLPERAKDAWKRVKEAAARWTRAGDALQLDQLADVK